MKRLVISILIPFLFLSCWIDPKIEDYEKIGDTYYFNDFDTMNNIIRPIINDTFPSWHWNTDKFEEKYSQYLNNITATSEQINDLNQRGYEYMAKKDQSNGTVSCINAYGHNCVISGYYFLIVHSNGDAVVFFESSR